jgi:hypothetical protein
LWIEERKTGCGLKKRKTPLASIKGVRHTNKCLLFVGEPPPVIFDESLLRRQLFQKPPSGGSVAEAPPVADEARRRRLAKRVVQARLLLKGAVERSETEDCKAQYRDD